MKKPRIYVDKFYKGKYDNSKLECFNSSTRKTKSRIKIKFEMKRLAKFRSGFIKRKYVLDVYTKHTYFKRFIKFFFKGMYRSKK